MNKIKILQIKVGKMQNFSYIIHSERDAIVIDASFGGKEILNKINQLKVRLHAILSTHSHFDHNMDNQFVKNRTGAKIIAYKESPIEKDEGISEGDVLNFGDISLHVMHTPGHTEDSVCYLLPDSVFTGDTLFVDNCGRVDLPGSDAEKLFESLQRLTKLPPSTKLYPGHNYGDRSSSTIEEQLKTNPCLQPKTKEEFIRFIF